jgi:hypothetical protein
MSTARANPAPQSRHRQDRDADRAAAKVRHTAERQADDEAPEQEKNQTATDTFEAHAELERPKHYRGRPQRAG